MSTATKFELAQQSSLAVSMANSGSTKKDIVEAFVAKGMNEDKAIPALNYISSVENIVWRGAGAQGWREVMTAEFEANQNLGSKDFRKILDDQFPKMKESRRIEYTRYFFPMMSELRKMKTS